MNKDAIAAAMAKVKAKAAQLSAATSGGGGSGYGGGDPSSELGKRKNRWDSGESQPASGYGVGMMQRKKVYIPTREHPDINFLGLLIGPRGRTQKELENRTGTKITIRGRGSHKDGMPSGHPDDDDDLHVCIEGPDDSVRRAMGEIEDILFNPEQAMKLKEEQLRNLASMQSSLELYNPGSSIQRLADGESMVELQIPNHLVGFLIGKGGENIQKMQHQTGVHVQIAKESEMKPGETMRSVVLRGTEGGVAEAKRRVDDLVKEKLTGGERKPKGEAMVDNFAFVMKVAVPNDKVGIIIGKGGVTVKAIQDRTMCHIQIPPGPDEDNNAIRTLSICGDTLETVKAGQQEIENCLTQQAQQANAPMNAMFMVVPDDKVGIVIGRGGSTIKEIQMRYNVRIQIPQSADPGTNPPVRTISIQGNPGDQTNAKYEIEGMVGISNGYDQGGGYGGYGGQQQYSGAYGGADASSYYGASAYGQSAGADASAAAQPDLSDPTAYYTDFWNYAAYYGEAAARAYYTTWSPPEGTPPPDGIVLPSDSGTTAPAAAPADASGAQQCDDAALKAYHEQYAEYYRQMAQQQAGGQQEGDAPPPPPS